MTEPSIGPGRGAALYVASLVGPGLLLVPSIAAREAGPASIIAWVGLIVVSAPLAAIFAALGVRYPEAGGVAAYARAAFGRRAGAVVGGWMLTAIAIGAPTVSVMGGYYVADLLGSGSRAAVGIGFAMFLAVLGLNALGIRVSANAQTVLSAVLVAVVVVGVVGALPHASSANWHPFAPRGAWAIGSAASVLVWLYVGWEAVAQLVPEFRRPARDLARAVVLSFAVVTVLYVGLAVATIGVAPTGTGRVPLANLMAVSLGEVGRRGTALLAMVLTMGTMNVYEAGGAKLARSLAEAHVLPAWTVEPTSRSIPRRPLILMGAIGSVLFAVLLLGKLSPTAVLHATSACFVSVYVASGLAAIKLLPGRLRALAVTGCVSMVAVAVFSGAYLLVPLTAGTVWFVIAAPRRRSSNEPSLDLGVEGL